jgi:uncharacterized protein (DUF1015 family)
MARLEPFFGLRPPRALVKQIAAPPYDVVNRDEAARLAAGSPRSFFHISRPEIDFGPEVDEHDDAVYRRAAENLRAFMRVGWLEKDPTRSFYLYRQVMGGHAQTGVVAAASVEEYDAGLILKHELTRADKEDDRTKHVDALGGNDEPVFLTYRARGSLDALVAEGISAAPEYDFQSDDGVKHTFWVVPPELGERLRLGFREVEKLYIADGHHRSAAASRVRKLRRDRGAGEGGHDFFLAVVFPHDQMQILDYNRVVKDLNGLDEAGFLARVAERFEVQDATDKRPPRAREFRMYLGGKWRALRATEGSYPVTPVGQLDVSILQQNLLSPILGIGDPRTDKRIHFVGGIRGPGELERLVDGGDYQVAFAMHPTGLEELMAIADAGEIMPPKSTWFEPKLRSGLVLHPFE